MDPPAGRLPGTGWVAPRVSGYRGGGQVRFINDGYGGSWSAETDLSTFVSGFSYIFADGFRFPFGDYFEMDIDADGLTHFIWGEGFNYDSPGSIWYSRGR